MPTIGKGKNVMDTEMKEVIVRLLHMQKQLKELEKQHKNIDKKLDKIIKMLKRKRR